MDNIQVRKRDDNTLQPWDRSKVTLSVTKAGVDPEEAEHLTYLVEAWVKRSASDGIIRSAVIRGTVIEILKLINPQVAHTFDGYKNLAE